MSALKNVIESTKMLPLKDTAFFFFMRRSELDYEENPGTVRKDLGAAREGSSFRRLRILFPQASDEELESALKAAAKFGRDCEHQIDWASGVDQTRFVAQIVERARLDNPGFAEATIMEARRHVWRSTK